MVNRAKIKGTRWETDNVRFLNRWWPKIKRAALEGIGDIGDLTHPESWAVECKDRPYAGNVPKFLREAEDEANNRGVSRFVAIIKNRRSAGETGQVQDGYAVTRTRVWAEVAHALETAEEFVDYVTALDERRRAGSDRRNGITDSTFCVLVTEALLNYADEMERASDGEATD